MKKIILDTNFLLIPFNFKVDIFSEIDRICNFRYELFIVKKTEGELKKIIEKQGGRHRESAKMALQLIKTKHLKTVNKNQTLSVDEIILDMAGEDTIVATQDKVLKQKLRKKGIPVILLRQKKYLKFAGE